MGKCFGKERLKHATFENNSFRLVGSKKYKDGTHQTLISHHRLAAMNDSDEDTKTPMEWGEDDGVPLSGDTNESLDPNGDDKKASSSDEEENNTNETGLKESVKSGNWSARNSVVDESETVSSKTSEFSPKPIRITDADADISTPKMKVVSPKIIRKAKPIVNPALNRVKGLQSRHKSSSTSSLYTESTIGAPDIEEVIKCMSTAIYWNIKNNEKVEKKVLPDTFSEEKYPLDDNIDLVNTPNQTNIHYFINVIFKAEQLSAECGVMCMAYIDRLVETTNITLHASNWRRIVLGALMLASKVWEDQAVWNVDFLSLFPNITVNDLNKLERHYLNSLKFSVSLSGAVYAKYYFELKSLSKKAFPLQPLSAEGKKN